ncbi:MAG: hypothetical protein AMK69_07055 [Nitrospira bacterium SG8_3]|nr:MAG: hypothetical protein AMK69_07055 [Nitrospira bacterium SG8_3]
MLLPRHAILGVPADGGIVLPFRRYGNDEALLADVVVAGSCLRVPLSTACGKALKGARAAAIHIRNNKRKTVRAEAAFIAAFAFSKAFEQ